MLLPRLGCGCDVSPFVDATQSLQVSVSEGGESQAYQEGATKESALASSSALLGSRKCQASSPSPVRVG